MDHRKLVHFKGTSHPNLILCREHVWWQCKLARRAIRQPVFIIQGVPVECCTMHLTLVLRLVELLQRLSCSTYSVESMALLFQPSICCRHDIFANGPCPACRSVVARVDSLYAGLMTVVPTCIRNLHPGQRPQHAIALVFGCTS